MNNTNKPGLNKPSNIINHEYLKPSTTSKRLSLVLNSPFRNLLNKELRRILDQLLPNNQLLSDLYYHLRLDTSLHEITIAHSKRLRGILCLLIAKGVGVETAYALPIACAIELFHNASLILDDIEDGSEHRCDRKALWYKSGISEAINAAFLLNISAELTLLRKSSNNKYYLTALQELISTLALVAEGQTRDLKSRDYWGEGSAYYYETTRLKTGILLGTTCKLGTFSRLSPSETQLVREFGVNLGFAHQIEDDIDDLIALQGGIARRLDPGNIAYFAAFELGLLDKSPQTFNCLVQLLKKESMLWREFQKKREDQQKRVDISLAALKCISPEIRAELYNTVSILCHRNDLTIGKILCQMRAH